jgi:molybdopterin-guanine dinucleotide biosynthesis protein A
MLEYNAIIIAGGRATRLGGIDKTALRVNGRTLLQNALDAVRGARQISVVGFGIDLEPDERISRTEEVPRWGGPAAALAAGLSNLHISPAPHTVVIAADMPHVVVAVALLLDAVDDSADGVIAVDSMGRRQHLLGVYRSSALRRATAEAGSTNAAMRGITGAMALHELVIPDELCADIDTPADAVAHGVDVHAQAVAG